MRIVDCDQGSAEWLQAKVGKVSGSRVGAAIDFNKSGKSSAERDGLKIEILTERLTGRLTPRFVSSDMQRGSDLEPLARAAYEIEYAPVDQFGFVLHPTIALAGYSPDGISDGKLIEIKCPRATTHVKWMLAGVLPEEHEPQVSFGMCCCELDEAVFISFCPEMPEHLQLWTVNVKRDEARIAEINAAVEQFLAEVDEKHQRLANASAL